MASSSVFMKRHDTLPTLDVVLQDTSGNAIDLSVGVSSGGVKFTMVDATTKAIKVDNSDNVIIADASNGKVQYSWQSGDTDKAGIYLGEFQITYDSGGKQTVPTNGTLSIVILEDYDNG